jgi:hypothetical protein
MSASTVGSSHSLVGLRAALEAAAAGESDEDVLAAFEGEG